METQGAPVAPEKKTPWYLSRATVIWGLFFVGPFALPILWLSPKFKMSAKIIISVVTAVLVYLSFLYTPKIIDMLLGRLEELQRVK